MRFAASPLHVLDVLLQHEVLLLEHARLRAGLLHLLLGLPPQHLPLHLRAITQVLQVPLPSAGHGLGIEMLVESQVTFMHLMERLGKLHGPIVNGT